MYNILHRPETQHYTRENDYTGLKITASYVGDSGWCFGLVWGMYLQLQGAVCVDWAVEQLTTAGRSWAVTAAADRDSWGWDMRTAPTQYCTLLARLLQDTSEIVDIKMYKHGCLKIGIGGIELGTKESIFLDESHRVTDKVQGTCIRICIRNSIWS